MRSIANYTKEIIELKRILHVTQSDELIKRQYQRRLNELIGNLVTEHKLVLTKEGATPLEQLNKTIHK